MADIPTNEELAEQIDQLKKDLANVKENTGGVLSGYHIRRRVIHKKSEVEEYLNHFRNREWDKISKMWPKEQEDSWKRKFVIQDYDELNVTPFSYDLSLGDQFFSTQKPEEGVQKIEEDQAYELGPRETVVVITKELVAIPHAYSATVWPRFNMVKRGVFQSMVKIDPTWHGKLAVAISNLSPATVSLNVGKAFATLLLYELSEPSDVDLWKVEELKGMEVDAAIPEQFHWDLKRIDSHINSNDLRATCWRHDKLLKVVGIKRKEVNALKKCFNNAVWRQFIDTLAEKWAQKEHHNERRIIVMPALGMNDLATMVQAGNSEGFIKESDVRGEICTEEDCISMAVRHGKPFDVIAKMPNSILERIENESVPQIEAKIESNIQVRVVLLVFSMFGLLSLGIAATRMLISNSNSNNTTFWENFAYICSALGIITAIGFLGLIFAGRVLKRKKSEKPWRDEKRLKKNEKELKKWFNQKVTEINEMQQRLDDTAYELQNLSKKSTERVTRLLKIIKGERKNRKNIDMDNTSLENTKMK